MFAVVQYGNQQYKVKPNQVLAIDKITTEEGKTFSTNEVLLVNDAALSVGTPFIEGATCEAKVLKHMKADKVIVFKKKSKKRYERTQGHRQDYTQIQIVKIEQK